MRSRRNVNVTLQRRHYEVIANIINDWPTAPYCEAQKQQLAEHFARHLRHTNPHFDDERFITFATTGKYPAEIERDELIKARAARKAEREAKRAAKAEANKIKAEAKEAAKYYKAVSNKAALSGVGKRGEI